MTTPQSPQLDGHYYAESILLDVKASETGLVVSLPDLPAEYAIRGEPQGENRYRLIGGPAHAAAASFELGDDGIATALHVGPMVFPRVASAAGLHVTGLVAAPAWQRSAEQNAAFDGLLNSIDEQAGAWIDYDLPYPKHEFLRYVTGQDRFIFHGSNNRAITEFAPIRKSVELYDDSGRGNLQAIYGTHEALWAMFFATVDRSRLQGRISSGFAYYLNRQDDALALFNFSINEAQLTDQPYCDGAMYFLPRNAFRRIPLWGDVMSNEWACEQAITSVAKLRLTPSDFPFLHQIEGHDDTDLVRMHDLMDELATAAYAAELEDERMTLWLAGAPRVEDYVALQSVFMPMVEYQVEITDDGKKLTASNLPPAMRDTLLERFRAIVR